MTNLPESFLEIPLAHRALHDAGDGRPENSRAAVRAAIQSGYGIEIDIQLTADDQAVVIHDYELSRLTHASGPVRQRTLADLENITLRGGREGIPSLTDILELVNGQVPLLIEIKDQDGAMGRSVGPLETAVAKALHRYPGPVAVMSFNPYSVGLFQELLPDVARGLTTGSYRYEEWPMLPKATADQLRTIGMFDEVGASFISHEASDLARDRVAELRAAGTPILCWTIYSPEQEARARHVAHNITFEGYLPDRPKP